MRMEWILGTVKSAELNFSASELMLLILFLFLECWFGVVSFLVVVFLRLLLQHFRIFVLVILLPNTLCNRSGSF